ncbi:MAG TPA: type IV pili twitching motility protein PilT, partial [bacterium]|nr:type IV pili twitching motility protein PilT [bacterium]
MAVIDKYFTVVRDRGGSDLHLSISNPPMIRKDGEMMIIEGEAVLTHESVDKLLREIMPDRN